MTTPANPTFFSNIKGNLMGGLIAAVVALPLALAFGVASGLGAQAGLYGAIACGLLAGLWTGTPGQVSGPTGPMTVVVAGMFAAQGGDQSLIFSAIILAGILQVALGALRSGQLIHYIPYPVLSGFMTGIGLIIICVQIPPLFGLPTPGNATAGLKAVPVIAESLNTTALLLGAGTIAIIYLLPRFFTLIPPTLIALIACTVATVMMGLEVPQIKDVGQIPTGLPDIILPRLLVPQFSPEGLELYFETLLKIFPAAFSLALLGAIDSLLTSLVVDKITRQRHDSNRELFGQGLGNIMSGLIGGLPGAGATMRSVVNVKNGGTSGLSAVVHGIILLAVLLGLGSLASLIPLACLAGILITVGLGILDYRGLRTIGKASKDDMAVMITVLLLTVFMDLIMAVLIGLALATFLFCKRMSDMAISEHGHLDQIRVTGPLVQDSMSTDTLKEYYCYTFIGPLFFGEARNFTQVIYELPPTRAFILYFQDVPMIDQTGAFALEDALDELALRNIDVICVGMPDYIEKKLTKLGILEKIPPGNRYGTLENAIRELAQKP